MKFLFRTLVIGMLLGAVASALSQDNRVDYNKQKLFLSGANLAWVSFARDIGPGVTDFNKIADIMLSMHDHGGNALRWWLHTNGTSTPQFDSNGIVVGPGVETIADLKKVLDLAWEREIGLKLCLWSFDMLRSSNNATVLNRNKLLLNDSTYTRQYINNCLIPMVDSLKGHPAIIAWEIFNEPEGMSFEFGWNFTSHVPMAAIQRFVNLCAGAIHRRDPQALVTNGAWSFYALTDVPTTSLAKVEAELSQLSAAEKKEMEMRFAQKYGIALTADAIIAHTKKAAGQANFNYYLDSRLIAAGGDPKGTLDFYSVHYYDWGGTPISPFHHPKNFWNLNKPLVVAEFAMQNTFGVLKENLFETLYRTGYAGALAWSWTDVQLSTPEDMLAAMQYMWDHYRGDVDVNGIGGDWPTVTLTSPKNDTAFANGAQVLIQASASDKDGSVVLVEFFANETTKIGERNSAPYSMLWTNIVPGDYRLTAVATDNQGHKRTSNIVRIKVGTPALAKLEAENAVRAGTPVIFRDATASNGSCLRMQQTGTITWAIANVPAAGTYEIVFGFRLPYDRPKNQYLNVNKTRVAEIAFDGNLNVWLEKKVNVNLLQGSNEIQIELSWGWMDIDYLAVPNSFISAVKDESEPPVSFALQQNYPNPFNPATTIQYSLAKPEQVKLVVYNLQGQRVRMLVNARQNAGSYVIAFDGRDLAGGVYFYQLQAGGFFAQKRMLLLR